MTTCLSWLDALGWRPGFMIDARVAEMYRRAVENDLITPDDALACRDILAIAGWRVADGEADFAVNCLLAGLFSVCNQGSLCLPLDVGTLETEFGRLLATSGDVVDSLPAAGHVAARAASLIDDGLPLFANPDGWDPYPLVTDGRFLWFSRHHVHETGLNAALQRLALTPGGQFVSNTLSGMDLESVVNQVGAGREGRDLNDRQKSAVMKALVKRFVVVSGGPGTGKTRILAALLRAWCLCGAVPGEMLLVAPTGRAGRRMGESISAAIDDAIIGPDEFQVEDIRGLTGSTIHRALGFRPSWNDFRFGPDNPLPHRYVVCDEVSMVDAALMNRLLQAVRPEARVVFLGDRDQLPSVDSGTVLADIIPRGDVSGPMKDSIVMLSQSYRAGGQVLSLAGVANAGDGQRFLDRAGRLADRVPDRDEWGLPGAACVILRPDYRRQGGIGPMLESWVSWIYGCRPEAGSIGRAFEVLAARRLDTRFAPDSEDAVVMNGLFRALETGRILCVLRDGPEGVVGINRAIGRLAGGRDGLFAGCPVLVTRNIAAQGLFNGDVGMVMNDLDGQPVAVFDDGGVFRSFPVQSIPGLEPAFATTVHKSQGSEYGNVLLFLPSRADHPLLVREILYTAMTRAKNNVWIHGTDESIRGAISRKVSRYSGMSPWNRPDPPHDPIHPMPRTGE